MNALKEWTRQCKYYQAMNTRLYSRVSYGAFETSIDDSLYLCYMITPNDMEYWYRKWAPKAIGYRSSLMTHYLYYPYSYYPSYFILISERKARWIAWQERAPWGKYKKLNMKNIYLKILLAGLPSIALFILGINILENPVQVLWFVSYFYFIITLSLTPLVYIVRKKIPFLKKYCIWGILLRRQFGIFTAVFALMHMSKTLERIWELYTKFFATQQSIFDFVLTEISRFWGDVFWMPFIAFWLWVIWIFILILLLITSNNYSQKILWGKNWKKLQSLTYPLFLIIVAHIYFIGWWKGIYLYPALILILLRLIVFLDRKKRFL